MEALSSAVGKLPACPQRGRSAAQTCWARKQRDGLMQEFLLSTLLWYMGHGSPEQNFYVPTETAPREHFCTEICILQAAGEAFLGEGALS